MHELPCAAGCEETLASMVGFTGSYLWNVDVTRMHRTEMKRM